MVAAPHLFNFIQKMSRERKPAPDVEHMHTLKVDNLSSRTTEADLKEVFGKHGEVGKLKLNEA